MGLAILGQHYVSSFQVFMAKSALKVLSEKDKCIIKIIIHVYIYRPLKHAYLSTQIITMRS